MNRQTLQKTRKALTKIAAVVSITALAFLLAQLARESAVLQSIVASYGYVGIFFISVASGFNLFVPIPAISFLPLYLEAGLSYGGTLIIITVGTTLADSIAYVLGRLGREIASHFEKSAWMTRLDRLKEKHDIAPLLILFLFAAFMPLPNELLLIPLGIMGYRFIPLLGVLILGNGIFNTLAASAVVSIFGVLG